MALREALAALLLAGPTHGYELMSALEAELGSLWEIRTSRIYLTLARMEQEGLVTSTYVHQGNRPDRRLLRLTSRGRSLAQGWLGGEGLTDDATVRLAVARVVGSQKFDALVAVLINDRSARLRRLRDLRRQADGGFQLEAVDAQILGTLADLRWLSLVRDRSREILTRPRARRRHVASDRAS